MIRLEIGVFSSFDTPGTASVEGAFLVRDHGGRPNSKLSQTELYIHTTSGRMGPAALKLGGYVVGPLARKARKRAGYAYRWIRAKSRATRDNWVTHTLS